MDDEGNISKEKNDILLMEEILHQYGESIYTIILKEFYTSKMGFIGFLPSTVPWVKISIQHPLTPLISPAARVQIPRAWSQPVPPARR